MIVEFVLDLIFNLIYGIISIIPNEIFDLPGWFVQTLKILRVGLSIFPVDVFRVCIANGVIWLAIQFNWSMIEWIYKKIPGVD